jgi:hypothetical protein
MPAPRYVHWLANSGKVPVVSDHDAESRSTIIRVLAANLSAVLIGLAVQLIAQQPDMVLVGQVHGSIDLLVAVGHGVDVLILGAPQVYPMPAICSHLLNEYPDLRILVVTSTGEAAMLYWLGLRRQQLSAVSAVALISSIRHAYALNAAS